MRKGVRSSSYLYTSALLLLVATTFFVMSYKLFFLDYRFADLIPTVGYDVEVNLQVSGHGDAISLSTYLPVSSTHQSISDERSAPDLFTTEIAVEGLNRIVSWKAPSVSGTHIIRYSYFVEPEHSIYLLEKGMPIQKVPAYLQRYLEPEEGIQVNDPLIEETIHRLFGDKKPKTYEALRTIHDYLQNEFENRNFSGYTDALTALKLQEASCNGKSRLFVALTRRLGLPSRLVGGLILHQGSKKTSHQWVEVYVLGHWIPFDTVNNNFAEIPKNYLRLYYGDKVLFKHSPNVNFQYMFHVTKKLVPRKELKAAMYASPLNAFNLYKIFESIGISQNLLKIILMIPLGALVVVIFRNVIGLETFGTFLPALIATAARETGLWWGLLGFMFIILLAAGVRKVLDHMQLLHSPKMAIMLTIVVIAMLLMTIFAVQSSLFDLAHISLFPIAILAITAERFAIVHEEQGLVKALRISFFTLIVIIAAYVVMSSLFMQSLIIAFPELLLFLIVLNLWLGKWVGMRLSEFIRFRKLLFKERL
ncbi:7TM domain-containing protein [Sulfurimonas sp. HSL3-7]|uniref:7TM domain-containing protein n=1 Tax=Sulfonitrofixus jiaomeiensis TaxID=3131938 RepID=UPI0031F81727